MRKGDWRPISSALTSRHPSAIDFREDQRLKRVTRAACFALTALICGANAIGAAPHFSMDAVLSAPFVNDLTASPDGTSLAFTADERGRRNLYLSANGGAAMKITSYSQDDGEVLGDLQIVPGNRAVVFVRGEGTNDRGEYPNPLTLPDPPKQHVFIVSSAGGTPIDLGEGHSAAVSPQGDRVIWILKGQPYSATISTQGDVSAGKAERLFEIRGALAAPVFSPDGSRVAFANVRGDHGFVVIYDLHKQTLTYATPAFAYDSQPAWSPDGTRIAYIRTPALLEDEDPYDDPVKEPWSIWVANAATGAAQQIFKADPGMGSEYYGTDSTAQLWWSRNGRVAFDWEKDGWRHLYSADANASHPSKARQLTPGHFEVETVVRSFDGSHLIFTSNQADIDRRHVWSVSFDGGHAVEVTSGTKDQWSPVALARGFAYVQAGYARPPAVYLSQNGSAHALAGGPVVPAEFPSAQLVQPQLVTFKAPDGLTIHGQLFVPKDGVAKHCGLIFDHGGSRRQMLPGFHYMETYTNLYESNQYYANHACVVLSINYRSGIMYGHDFRQAKNYGWKGASEYQDVLAGAAFLQRRADVDGNRIGIYGLSYGGYLTALALARNSDIFKAGVDMAGVHNWATIRDADYGHKVGTARERQIAVDASPIAAVNRWRSPVFMSQGDDDRNVVFSQGVDLATRLRARHVEVVELVFPNETHENITYRHMLELYEDSSTWLLHKLGAR
jgi:dipeptidyl aminopeptidase/acylaminoacyl peptidase